ncbi:MAG: RidA family protein [Blastocatellia bacterium]|nr:RidA family protein [Blastocatellia bacterium]
MRTVQPSEQPQPKGHYSPGVEHNGLIYVSGQLPMSLDSREPFTGDIGGQTELALRNVEAVLRAAGSGLDHVLQMTIYVSDMEMWDAVNKKYAEVMGEHRPARAIVPVKDLHFGTKIEIHAIAALKS